MSDVSSGIYLGAGAMFFLCTFLMECDRDKQTQRYHDTACELSCKRNAAGSRYTADETFCTCTSGVALRRDRARLYIRVEKP